MAVILLFTACAAQKKTASTTGIDYLQMRRSACFGRCPVYKIEIYKDGLVRYTGERYMADTGIYEKRIAAAEAQRLLNLFTAKGVDTLKKEYQMTIADLPGIHYSFRYNGKTKDVRNAEFGPFYLREMANEIDKLVRKSPNDLPEVDNSWKQISEGPKGD